MLSRSIGVVVRIDRASAEIVEATVACDGTERKAVAYVQLVGAVVVGDRVLLNTTAVEKCLGSGGVDFVIANLSMPDQAFEDTRGHIVKLRYTPCQHTVAVAEEEGSPLRSAMEAFKDLGSMPVVIGQLHSQLAPSTAGIKRLGFGKVRLAYVMTDSAALALPFSRLVSQLRECGLIDICITCGQAFGGDIEAVNIYTALIAAHAVADVAIVCPGPGNTGTGTALGFSSIEQGEIVNAVSTLGGQPIAIARISFADSRPRHSGLSHHTLTALGRIALTKCTLVLPMMDQMRLMHVEEQISHSAIVYKHKIRVIDGEPGMAELEKRGISVTSMGRSYRDDPEFFLSAAAAGALAGQMVVQ